LNRHYKNQTSILKELSILVLSVILLGGLFPQQAAFADSVSFDTEINLSNNGSNSKTPEIFVSGSNVYVVWRDGDNIFFTISNNGGSLFSSATDIGDTGLSSLNGNPKVSVSGNNVYVIWKQDNDIKFINSANNGVSFSAADVQLSSNTNTSKFQIILSSGSTVLTAWHDQISGANDEITFKRSTDSGENFDSEITVGETDAIFPEPQITNTGSNVYVIWQNSIDIVFARSTNSGTSFNSEIIIGGSTGGLQKSSPQIAASGSNVYAIWQEDGDIKFSRSVDSGQSFSTPIDIGDTGGPNNIGSPQLAVSSSSVYAIWRDDSTGGRDIIFKQSTDSGVSFGFPTTPSDGNISNNSGISGNPKIEASGTNVHITWGDTTLSANGDIFYKISTDSGDTFGASQNVSNDSELSIEHALAISDSSPFVVWKDDNPGDILFRTGTLSPINISFDKTQYKISDTSTITVTGASGSVSATIQSDTDPTGISLSLTESPPGTFTGSFTFTEIGSSSGTTLSASTGDQITVIVSGTSSSASIFSRTVEFDGGFTTFDLASIAHVKVTDQNSNIDTGTAETIPVQVTSGTDTTGITLQLTETGIDTGVFGGSTDPTKSDLIFMLGNDLVSPLQTITIEQEEPTADTTSAPDQLTVDVTSTSDPGPGGITLTLTETGDSTGVFSGTLELTTGPSVPGTAIEVAGGDFLSVTRGTLTSNTLVIPNPNNSPNGAIEIAITPISGGTVTASYSGSSITATVSNANAPGGGGGGLVRPGLVVNVLAGVGGGGRRPPRTNYNIGCCCII